MKDRINHMLYSSGQTAGDLVEGLTNYRHTLRLLLTQPSLAAFSLIPLILHIFLAIGSFWIAFGTLSEWYPIAWPAFEWAWSAILPWFGDFFLMIWHILVHTLLALSIWVASFPLICAQFYQWLSDKVDKKLGILPGEYCTQSILRQIGESAVFSLLLIFGSIFIFLLSFIPFIGAILAVAIGIPMQGFLLGMELFDFPLTSRGLTLKEKLTFARQHIGQVMGCGLPALIFLPIPIVSSCLLTFSAVNAVLLTRTLRFKGLMKIKGLDPKDYEIITEPWQILPLRAHNENSPGSPAVPVRKKSSQEVLYLTEL
jgi:uncharacterized protein involved in cysteine biosynthesis